MNSAKRTFVVKLILFSLPILLVTAVPLGFAYSIGEIMPPSVAVMQRDAHPDLIYGPRFGRDMFTYNLLIINEQHPNVLVTGSSRAWLFRSEFFSKPAAQFYNASDAGWTLQKVDKLLQHIDPAAYPDVLLLGIDKPWFHPDFVPIAATTGSDDQNILQVTRAVIGFAAQNPNQLGQLLERREPVYGRFALGVSAITTGVGVRSDGSLQHGELIMGTAPISQMRAEHLGSLTSGSNMFVAGDEISASTLNQLDALLRFAQERGIQVIGFTPPFAPDIYHEMRSGGRHAYIWKLDPLLDDLFAQYGYPYFDFTNPASADAVEADFWDGWHASEQVSAQMLVQMVQGAPDILGDFVDVAFIQQAVQHAPSRFQVFSE